jgi:tRNA 5-methylaminomethyl-2-thiouridine biosynthesis bifunctional protein
MQSGSGSQFGLWLQDDLAQGLLVAQARANKPLVCLDLAADARFSLARMSQVLAQWVKTPGQGALHWVWVGEPDQWPDQWPEQHPVSASSDLKFEPAHWPPPLPGIHRCWSKQGLRSVSLTIGLGNPDQLVNELMLSADWVMVDAQLASSSLARLTHLAHPLTQWLSVSDVVVKPISVGAVEQTANRTTKAASDPLFAWMYAQQKAGDQVAASNRRAVVIGAGISGLTMAAVLGGRGWSVEVLDPHPPGPHSRHAQHLAAALTPVVSGDDNERSQLSRAGALAADRFWAALPTVIGHRCGALQLQRPQTQKRWVDLEAVSEAFAMPQWARWVDAQGASDAAGMALARGGLWMPGGWLIKVARLLEVLSQMPGVNVMAGHASRLRHQAGIWQVMDGSAQILAQAPLVIMANAADTNALLQRSTLWPIDDAGTKFRLTGLHQLAGEVTCLPAQAIAGGPACIVGGDGYVLPAVDGWCVSGGTYVRELSQTDCTPEGRQTNILRAAALLNMPSLVDGLQTDNLPGWAGFRAVLPGRLPALGPLVSAGCEGLWMQTAGASRGLTWSVLGAELVADAIEGVPLTLQKSLLNRLLPGI